MLMFFWLLAAFILAMLSADLKNVIIAKILKGFGYCIIIVLYIMLPWLFYSYKYNNKTWAYFSNYLNSDTFRIVTMSFIIVMLSLCGSLIYKLGLESAKNKNTYLYNEEKSAVLIFQDSTKSIFLNINDKGESQGKFFTLSDTDFDFTTYNSQIKIQ